MRSVRISLRAARALLALLPTHDERARPIRAVAEFRKAMEPRRSLAPARKAKRAERKTDNEETSGIRAEVFARAGGLCEMCKGAEPTDLQHTMGRVKRPQGVTNTLAICRPCHLEATKKTPEALDIQARRLELMGYRYAASDLRGLAEWLGFKAKARERLKSRTLVSLDEELRIERAEVAE